ncbi:hypothetical protein CMO93_03190 [Candidatus Woesearchaeota archaeon]|nr:hypothetical protein [Candidatus Woesearchaeota archaeon]|tara:strand:- start:1141 stop:4641 length:3501 start_codon:yes stop_codon:yes gene_type:complete
MIKKSPSLKNLTPGANLISKGYFSGEHSIAFKKLSRSESKFDKVCFVFPGQGSVYPGMFKEEYLAHSVIRNKFKKTDKFALKYGLHKPSDYILSPEKIPSDQIDITANLCLFTLEAGLHELLISLGVKPRVITGHSFGEFAALVASGIISFEQMLELVYYRDVWSPKKNDAGFMVAINANKKKIRKILANTNYYVSNLNSPEQTVISVVPKDLEVIKKILKKAKIRLKVLDVPQPYHSPLLEDVGSKMGKLLKLRKLSLQKPKIWIFSSVSKQLINSKTYSYNNILDIIQKQITTPIDFIYQLNEIDKIGCGYFIEVGPGTVLSAFIKEIADKKDIIIESVTKKIPKKAKINDKETEKSDLSKSEDIILSTESKFVSLVNRAISNITGYKIEKISLDDRFGEDLGIDSIKKAEIVFEVLDKSDIAPNDDLNLSAFRRVADLIGFLKKKPSSGQNSVKKRKKKSEFNRYVPSWIPNQFNKNYLIEKNNHSDLIIDLGAFFNKSFNVENFQKSLFRNLNNSKKNIIFLCNESAFSLSKESLSSFEKILSKSLMNFIGIFRYIANRNKYLPDYSIAIITQGNTHPFVFGMVSFLKSLKKEYPNIFVKHIHFDSEMSKKRTVQQATYELYEPHEADVMYHDNKRYVACLKKIGIGKKIEINKKTVMVVVGGAKGIAFSLIKKISKQYCPIIYILGRSALRDGTVRLNIKKLIEHNSNVHYERVDATDYGSLKAIFQQIARKHKRIDIIINGAGVEMSRLFAEKTTKEIKEELNNKIFSGFNIGKLSLIYNPSKVINFSSVVSKFGNEGQTIYSCANEILNKLAVETNVSSKSSSSISVNWPPWDDVGMTSNKATLYFLKEKGISLLDPLKANELFFNDLSSLSKNSEIFYFDESDYEKYHFMLQNLQLYSSLIGKVEPSDQDLSFKKILSLAEDTYLSDHRINGVIYMPAAVSIAMFLCSSSLYFKGFPVLSNFNIKNPTLIGDKDAPLFTEGIKLKDNLSMKIKNKITYASCEAKLKSSKTKKRVKKFKKPASAISNDSIYNKNMLFHGPSFQVIDKVFLDKKNIVAKVDNKKLVPLLDAGIYGKIIQWIDSAFQSLAYIGIKNGKGLSLPVSVYEIIPHFENIFSNILYILPNVKKITSRDIIGDVEIVNEKNEVILEFNGIKLKIAK